MPIKRAGEKTMTIHQQDGTLEIRIPIRWMKAKGQRRIHSNTTLTKPLIDETLRLNLVKAHRWDRMLLEGKATSLKELAQIEKVDKSDISKILKLTSLAPDIQADIILRRGKWLLTWAQIKFGFSPCWESQRSCIYK